MGRKIVCPKCNTIFDEDVLKQRNSEDTCLVCAASLSDDIDNSSCNEILSFGEGIELGENDSFDEDKIDFWWYEIREPGTLGNTDCGDVGITCTSCGHLSGTSYPISKMEGYILLDPRAYAKCSGCGKELKNYILSKRPVDWVDPRQRIVPKDYENIPKCPICSSTKIHKISMTNKAATAITFGVLAAGHVSKTWKCNICGSKF